MFPLAAALAAPQIRIEATVDPSLRIVRGTMELPPQLDLIDPLALLPEPGDDLQLLRTYPGAPSAGALTWHRDGSQLTFEATLPRRYGALGATRIHGLFANGGWYPQPMDGGRAPVATWDVVVHLPPDTTGALGSTVGAETLAWHGEGERASLAVLPRGRITRLEGPHHDVALLTRGAPRPGLLHALEDALQRLPSTVAHGPLVGDPDDRQAVFDGLLLEGAVVQAPQRRRLVRHGPGLAYVSDRAFRLSPGLGFVHRDAVSRGLLAAWVDDPDPFERELIAEAMGQIHEQRLGGPDTGRLLRRFRWLPQINNLLASRRTPFYSEILEQTHPGDPVLDDLMEIVDPYTPGRVVVAQLDDRHGRGTGRCVGYGLANGRDLEQVCAACGTDAAWLASWRAPYPVQDYVLSVEPDRIVIDRQAPEGAQIEAVELRIDGGLEDLVLEPGEHVVPLDHPPHSVSLDPRRHTRQLSRAGDSWPPRYDLTFAAWLTTINVSEIQVFGVGSVTLRKLYDTHNLWIGSISNNASDLVAVDVSYLRKEGPLLDGLRRPHRLRLRVGASLLDSSFAETNGLRIALDTNASWTHDTRVSGDFPLRGHRLSTSIGGGLIPGTDDVWGSVSLSALGIASPHPRHAFAAHGSLALARATLPHRLLTLGGSSRMRSIPILGACDGEEGEDPTECNQLAGERAVGRLEYRTAPARGWSVPLLLAWGTELQLTAGLEGTVARTIEGQGVWATGVTVGALGLGDVLGAESSGIGLTAAWPALWSPLLPEIQGGVVPELYLRFSQAF